MATINKSITSNTFIGTDSSTLLPKCSQSFLANLRAEIIDQDLSPTVSGGVIYSTGNTNLLEDPPVKVRTVDLTTGVETVLDEGADYTINHATGEITLSAPTSDTVRVDYFYRPLSDETLDTLFNTSIQEIAVLIHRPITVSNIPAEYETAICLQFAINVLKTLLIETRDFFSISVAGKTVNKVDVPKTFDLILKQFQENLMLLIKQLRDWNISSRLE